MNRNVYNYHIATCENIPQEKTEDVEIIDQIQEIIDRDEELKKELENKKKEFCCRISDTTHK